MSEPEGRGWTSGPFEVYGAYILVKMIGTPPAGSEVFCPKTGRILYGEVAAFGDGFDPACNQFRDMPRAGALVTFEESDENVEGHYFFVSGQEFRVVHIDSLIVSFPRD